MGEPAVRVNGFFNLYYDARIAELSDHRIEIVNAEIDPPLVRDAVDSLRFLGFCPENRGAFILPPGAVLVFLSYLPDAEVFFIPSVENLRVFSPEEESADTRDFFHHRHIRG